MKRYLAALIIMSFFLLGAESGTGRRSVFRAADGKIISFEQMIGDLRKANVVFAGELHNSMENHREQLEIIKALNRTGASLAVGLEMFRAESQKALDQWVDGKMDLERFLPVFYENWRMPWPLYRDIFFYARDNKIPMVGLNIPESIAAKVSRSGFSSLSAEQKKELPPDIKCDVDPPYMDFIRRAYAGHDQDSRSFHHFCEAQMVWDASMAKHLMGYLKKNPGRTVVVLTGTGHARKHGMPEQVKKGSKLSYTVILPEISGHIERRNMIADDADYILLR